MSPTPAMTAGGRRGVCRRVTSSITMASSPARRGHCGWYQGWGSKEWGVWSWGEKGGSEGFRGEKGGSEGFRGERRRGLELEVRIRLSERQDVELRVESLMVGLSLFLCVFGPFGGLEVVQLIQNSFLGFW